MTGLTPGWSMIDGAATAWFETSSLVDSVALGRRIVERVPASSIDVRHSGLQVRLNPDEDIAAVAGGILELGSVASEAAPPRIGLVIESPHPEAVSGFWHSALGYVPGERGALSDPLQRDPALQIRASSEHRPLRNRMHVDMVRPSAVVEQVSPGEPGGPYGLRHSDADGNEVDLVPGEADEQLVRLQRHAHHVRGRRVRVHPIQGTAQYRHAAIGRGGLILRTLCSTGLTRLTLM
ncbi:hypothetical protein M3F57_00245 [Brachybacterium muris]|uniref:hypothetical protein n=1 Tax=Brachybacterium muris TaxID=219301 RepID=UPI00223C3747|nr:hypothetical protein [Brachybacterium muris]MCT2294576.1 hypothetical protein [Brachybacterium muris]